MTEPHKTRENWALYIPMWILTAALIVAGALAAYWLTHIYFGYYGNKSAVFYIGGAFAGYSAAEPLWKLYRKRYPKAATDS